MVVMLRVLLCGGVSVEVDARRLPDASLAGRQGRLVLAYLVCERHRSVPREELAELLWSDRLPASWTSSLSVVVSKLRRLISEAGLDPAATLASSFGSYRLHLPQEAWVDVEAAAQAVERAEAAERAGRTDDAVAAATEGAEIAGRGFLTDDCAWVDAQRERMRDLHVRAVGTRARAHLLAGQSGRAVISARDALALDELREGSYRLLMQALAAAGERGEALRVWERCRVMLGDELGVDPAPETEAVYLSVLGETSIPPARTGSGVGTLPSGVVTFLLTDIVDSSALWEQHPAAMAVALERHDQLVAVTVGQYGGTVLKAKLEGDATVSVFIKASEAVGAALTLRRALMDEAWPEGAGLRVRMALHTGEALERAGDYFGPALNRAARLRALADADQILVSQAVAEVVADHLPEGTSVASLGERQLRGLSRTEHVFELSPLTGTGADALARVERPPLPAVLAAREVFVGRAVEFEQLAREWATATSGTARAVLIAGEPGVGKSRLAAEWARRAHDQGAMVLYGRCDEELGAPYQPFAEVLRAVLPVLGGRRLRSVRGVEPLARLVPELTDYLPGPVGACQADPDTERSLLFDGLVRLLGAAAGEAPLLVVIDDLHWAAKPTLLILRHLLRAGGGIRLLIVGTYRSTDLTRSHPLAAALADLHRDATAERLTLGGLAAEDVTALLRAAGHDDERLGETLSAVTSGNPFFLIEVLRHLEETGRAWDAATLPQGVREAVDRRLSHLSELANEALLVGAVAGSEFSLDLIEQVVGQDLVEVIDEACRAGLVVEETGDRFRFYHALVRQSLLAECVSVKRVRLHQRIAAALEADPAATGDAHVADLARHYFECAFAGGAAKAVEYSRRAGEQAMAALAYEKAAELYAKALQAAEIDGSGRGDEGRAELLLARCEALLAAGDPTTATEVVGQLASVARHSPRLSAWATCFDGQLAALSHPETLQSTVVEVEAAAEAFARLGDAEGEAIAHTVAASCLARLGHVADCEAALDRALVAARLADNPRRVNAVLSFAPEAALWGPHPVPQASGRCLDVVRVLRITTGSAAVEASALRCQAVLEAVRGRFDAARRMLASARRSLEALGHTHGLLETDLFSAIVELSAGQPAEAERLLRRAYDGFVARALGVDAAQAAALLARALQAQGRVDEAVALTEESERKAGVDVRAAIWWRTARAEALAQEGRYAEALDLARTAVALSDPTDALLDRAGASASLARVLQAAGEEAAAEQEARLALEQFDRKGATALVSSVPEMLGSVPSGLRKSVEAHAVHRRVRPNAAHMVFERGARLFEAGDLDAWAAAFAEDFVEIDHISHLTHDRQTFLEAARRFAAPQTITGGNELLASLGDRHALTRCTWRSKGGLIADKSNVTGPFEFVQLVIESIDTAGNATRSERFKADDLHLALARLIELHADDEVPPNRREGRYVQARQYRVRDHHDMWTDDIVLVDHRPAGLWTLQGRDAVRDASIGLGDLSADLRWRVIDILGLTERFALVDLVAEGHDAGGGHVQIRVVALRDCGDSGLIQRSELYEVDQIDEALARFDELVTGGAPAGRREVSPNRRFVRHNAATSQVEHLARLIKSRDIEGHSDEFSDDFVHVDHVAHVTLDRDAHLQATAKYSAFDDIETGFEVLATLGERHALTRWTYRYDTGAIVEPALRTGPIEAVQLLVTRVDSIGRESRLERFGASQLALALARLIELHADDELPPDRRQARYAAAEVFRPTAEVFRDPRERWSDDFVAVDHRWFAVGSLEGRDAATAFRAWHDVVADLRWRIVDVLAFSEDAAVLEFHAEGNEDQGGPIQVSFLLVNQVGADGLLHRSEIYDADQIDDALSRFEQLKRRPVEEYLANQATRFLTRFQQAILAGDWQALEEMTTKDLVLEDRRAILRRRAEGREAVLREWRSMVETGVTELSRVPIATRGRLLSLSRSTVGGRLSSVEVLGLQEVSDDGRLKRTVVFDTDDLDAAFAELDVRYLAGEGGPFADTLAPCFELAVAHGRRDWARCRDLLNDDFQIIDHSPAPSGYGRDSPDQFIASLRSMIELAPTTHGRILAVHSVQHGAVLVWSQTTVSTGEGVDAAWPRLLLGMCRQGKIARIELFRLDDLDTALLRLRTLREAETQAKADPGSTRLSQKMNPLATRRRIRPNTATAATDKEMQPWRTAGSEHWENQFSPDFVDVDHTSHTTTGREAMFHMLRIAASERVVVDAEFLASLGERHVLSRITTRIQDAAIADTGNRIGDLEIVLLIVTRVDTAGRTTRIERFKPDALGPALARLVELHADDELPPERRPGRHAVAEILRNQLLDSIRGAVEVDHRPAHLEYFKDSDVGQQVTGTPERRSARERWPIVDVFGFTEDVAVIEFVSDSDNVQGEVAGTRIVVINQFGLDGTIQRSELYSPDQLDEALARFDELSGCFATDPIPPPNTASLARRRAESAFARQDLAAHGACFTAGAVHEDRRPGMRLTVTGREAIKDRANMMGAESQADVALLATRGDRLSLDRVHYRSTHGDFGPSQADLIHVTETDNDGLITCVVSWGVDDLDAAFAELDSRYAAAEGRPFDWAGDVAATAAYNRRDWNAYESFLAEDLRYVDHRPARFGEQRRPKFLSASRTVFDLVPDAKVRVLAVPRLTTDGGVYVFERTGHDQTGAPVSWREIGIVLKDEGLIQRIESFPADDLPAALAHFDQVTPAPAPNRIEPRNSEGRLRPLGE
jgi:class 3 adenylate cyclase/tetratricopeptide (TPR) repeat protein